VDPRVIRAVRRVTPLTRYLRRVFPGLVDGISSRIRRMGTRVLPPLNPADRARLQAEFFPDFSDLESLIGRSLGHWRLNGSLKEPSGIGGLNGSSAGSAVLGGASRTQGSLSQVPGRTLRPSVPQPAS
jgi:hypothetical protein